MTEQEYINATNMAHLKSALCILQSIHADRLGECETDFRNAMYALNRCLNPIYGLIKLEESE